MSFLLEAERAVDRCMRAQARITGSGAVYLGASVGGEGGTFTIVRNEAAGNAAMTDSIHVRDKYGRLYDRVISCTIKCENNKMYEGVYKEIQETKNEKIEIGKLLAFYDKLHAHTQVHVADPVIILYENGIPSGLYIEMTMVPPNTAENKNTPRVFIRIGYRLFRQRAEQSAATRHISVLPSDREYLKNLGADEILYTAHVIRVEYQRDKSSCILRVRGKDAQNDCLFTSTSSVRNIEKFIDVAGESTYYQFLSDGIFTDQFYISAEWEYENEKRSAYIYFKLKEDKKPVN